MKNLIVFGLIAFALLCFMATPAMAYNCDGGGDNTCTLSAVDSLDTKTNTLYVTGQMPVEAPDQILVSPSAVATIAESENLGVVACATCCKPGISVGAYPNEVRYFATRQLEDPGRVAI